MNCKSEVEPQIGNLQGIETPFIDRWMPYFKENKAIVTSDIENIRESMPDEYEILKSRT